MMRTALLAILSFFATGRAVSGQAKSLKLRDVAINYELTGTGPTIVFIHGWAQDMGTWDDQVAAFSPHFRVLRYDRRGFGNSTGYADVSEDPADLAALLDSLRIKSASIVGLSAGAEVALRFALNYLSRVDGLVLYGKGPIAGFPRDAGPRGPPVPLREIAAKYGMDSLRKAVLDDPMAWMPPDRPDLRARVAVGLARYAGRDLLDPHPQSGRVPPAHIDSLKNVQVPTLVINGDHDMRVQLSMVDTLVARLPNARKVVVSNAGHGAHFAQPASFNSALMTFFREVERLKKP